MNIQSLSNRYRPQDFNTVLGQDSTTQILKKQVETNNISHSYLFCGPSGSGKTTLARILARKINNDKGQPYEIDAASNNGVDNIRLIIEDAKESPIDGSRYKVYIIDEVHMLTLAAFNALLKTLEDCYQYTIFIFCTTNPEKIPDTVQNRLMRFNFSPVSSNLIKNRLEEICVAEGFIDYEEGCDYISKVCEGNVRLAIQDLEKVANFSPSITYSNTLSVLGFYSYEVFLKLTNAFIDFKEDILLQTLKELIGEGKNLKSLVDQYSAFILDLIKYSIFKDITMTKLPQSLSGEVDYVVEFADPQTVVAVFNYILDALLELKNNIRFDDNIQLTIEGSFIKLFTEIKNSKWKMN